MSGLAGKWNIVVHTYMGDQFSTHEYVVDGDTLTGEITDGGNGNKAAVQNGKVDGNCFSFTFRIQIPIGDLEFNMSGELKEDGTIGGISKNAMGEFEFEGTKAE